MTNERLKEIKALIDDHSFVNRTPAEQSALEELYEEVASSKNQKALNAYSLPDYENSMRCEDPNYRP